MWKSTYDDIPQEFFELVRESEGFKQSGDKAEVLNRIVVGSLTTDGILDLSKPPSLSEVYVLAGSDLANHVRQIRLMSLWGEGKSSVFRQDIEKRFKKRLEQFAKFHEVQLPSFVKEILYFHRAIQLSAVPETSLHNYCLHNDLESFGRGAGFFSNLWNCTQKFEPSSIMEGRSRTLPFNQIKASFGSPELAYAFDFGGGKFLERVVCDSDEFLHAGYFDSLLEVLFDAAYRDLEYKSDKDEFEAGLVAWFLEKLVLGYLNHFEIPLEDRSTGVDIENSGKSDGSVIKSSQLPFTPLNLRRDFMKGMTPAVLKFCLNVVSSFGSTEYGRVKVDTKALVAEFQNLRSTEVLAGELDDIFKIKVPEKKAEHPQFVKQLDEKFRKLAVKEANDGRPWLALELAFAIWDGGFFKADDRRKAVVALVKNLPNDFCPRLFKNMVSWQQTT